MRDFWEFNTTTGAWTQKADVGNVYRQSAVGFSIGSKGYIGLGYASGGRTDLLEYDPASNTWSGKASFLEPVDTMRRLSLSMAWPMLAVEQEMDRRPSPIFIPMIRLRMRGHLKRPFPPDDGLLQHLCFVIKDT
jgi:hypothetical protein